MFTRVQISMLHSNNFQICCISKKHLTCTVIRKWYHSCSKLLSTLTLQIFYILLPVLVFIGNSISLLIHLKKVFFTIICTFFIWAFFDNNNYDKLYLIYLFYLFTSQSYQLHILCLMTCFVTNIFLWRKSQICVVSFFINPKLLCDGNLFTVYSFFCQTYDSSLSI